MSDEMVLAPKNPTDAMMRHGMLAAAPILITKADTREIYAAMIDAAEPRDLECITKEYFKAGCKWERELQGPRRNQVIRELIEKAKTEIECDVLGERLVPLHAAEWLAEQMEDA